MDVTSILSQLHTQRAAIDTAIRTLENLNGHRPKKQKASSSTRTWTPERRRKFMATMRAKKKANAR